MRMHACVRARVHVRECRHMCMLCAVNIWCACACIHICLHAYACLYLCVCMRARGVCRDAHVLIHTNARDCQF